jgi:hypothetical protein
MRAKEEEDHSPAQRRALLAVSHAKDAKTQRARRRIKGEEQRANSKDKIVEAVSPMIPCFASTLWLRFLIYYMLFAVFIPFSFPLPFASFAPPRLCVIIFEDNVVTVTFTSCYTVAVFG